jgi:hypothetical protein
MARDEWIQIESISFGMTETISLKPLDTTENSERYNGSGLNEMTMDDTAGKETTSSGWGKWEVNPTVALNADADYDSIALLGTADALASNDFFLI